MLDKQMNYEHVTPVLKYLIIKLGLKNVQIVEARYNHLDVALIHSSSDKKVI